MRNSTYIDQNIVMCCRMLISRASNMAGATGFVTMRLDKERC
jgi:hypothetical protein